jgi:hypothetical protein
MITGIIIASCCVMFNEYGCTMNSNFFNLSKRKPRDILFELLADKQSEGIISKKELNAVNKLIEGSPLLTAPGKIKCRSAKTENVTVAKKGLKIHGLKRIIT